MAWCCCFCSVDFGVRSLASRVTQAQKGVPRAFAPSQQAKTTTNVATSQRYTGFFSTLHLFVLFQLSPVIVSLCILQIEVIYFFSFILLPMVLILSQKRGVVPWFTCRCCLWNCKDYSNLSHFKSHATFVNLQTALAPR